MPPSVNGSEATEPEAIEPQVVTDWKPATPVRAKREKVLHALYDAKLETIDQLKLDAMAMDLEQWSRIVARLDRERDVKVEANITAMGIFAMFPVAMQDGENK